MKSQVHFVGIIAYFPVDSDGIDSSHSKKCWVVLTQFWVKYRWTQTLG